MLPFQLLLALTLLRETKFVPFQVNVWRISNLCCGKHVPPPVVLSVAVCLCIVWEWGHISKFKSEPIVDDLSCPSILIQTTGGIASGNVTRVFTTTPCISVTWRLNINISTNCSKIDFYCSSSATLQSAGSGCWCWRGNWVYGSENRILIIENRIGEIYISIRHKMYLILMLVSHHVTSAVLALWHWRWCCCLLLVIWQLNGS